MDSASGDLGHELVHHLGGPGAKDLYFDAGVLLPKPIDGLLRIAIGL
jgi:hypothetical protein